MTRIAVLCSTLALGLAVAAVALAGDGPPLGQADRIVIEKSDHRLTLYAGNRVLRRYAVAIGSGGLAAKRRQSDNRTPEGRYRIDWRNPNSAFHLALHISYPSAADTAGARARGEQPGGDIMIHGLPNGMGVVGALHRRVDWTAGCIAVTDEEIDEIWLAVPDGTPLEIKP
jgi:murein L,D-transpeptidase YafK